MEALSNFKQKSMNLRRKQVINEIYGNNPSAEHRDIVLDIVVRFKRQVTNLETEYTILHSIISRLSQNKTAGHSDIQAIMASRQAEEEDQSGLPDLNEVMNQCNGLV